MASPHAGPTEQGPLQNGQIFNNQYEIVRVIGTGGHAFVYLGRHRFLGHLVAIKVIHRASGVSYEMLKRAQAEAQIEFRLKVPGIVTVYDAGINDDGLLYIVMEFLRGCSGREALEQHRKLSVREVLRMAKSIATTLQVAHNAGVVHRDLKPENLFFTVEDITKVLDFGVAKIDEVAGWKTRGNSALGTFLYMSPEQALGYIVTHLSDIYTLGLIMFEMLTGTHPVIYLLGDRPMSMHALPRIICHELLPDLHELDPTIPSYVAKLVKQATEKNPDDRFRSMEELARAIQACEDLLDAEDARLGRRSLLRDLSQKAQKVEDSSGQRLQGSGGKATSEPLPASYLPLGVLPSIRAPQTPLVLTLDAQRPDAVPRAPVAAPNSSERPTVLSRTGAGLTAPLAPPQETPPKAIPAASPAPSTRRPMAPASAPPVARVVAPPVARVVAPPVASVVVAPAAAKPTAAKSTAAARSMPAPSPKPHAPQAEPEPQLPIEGFDFVRLLWGLAGGILIFGLAAAYWRSHASPAPSAEPALDAASASAVVGAPPPQVALPPEQPATPPPPADTPPAAAATAPSPSPAEAAPSTTRAPVVAATPAPASTTAAKPKTAAKSSDVTPSDVKRLEERLRGMGIDPNEKPRNGATRSTPPPTQTAKPSRSTVF